MNRNNYMTTGELAQLMGITKHTLFHYDDIGLFQPEYVNEKGYRFYSINQIDTLYTILMLRDLDIPLKEIQSYITQRSPQLFQQIFLEREDEIAKQIKKLQSIKKWMQQQRKKIQLAEQTDFSQIGITTYPKCYYLYREMSHVSDQTFAKAINALILQLKQVNSYIDYDIAYFQYAKNVEHGIYDAYDNVALLMEQKPAIKNCQILPAGKYLTAYHVGHWNTIGATYERIQDYKNQNHIQTEDLYIEYYVIDNFTAENIEEFVTKIDVKIIESE